MTKRKPRSESQLHGLKWLLAAGSLAAALIGTRLLAVNEPLDTAVVPQPEAQTELLIIPARPQLQMSGQPDGAQFDGRTIELAPIPEAAAAPVRPIARSRSSR